MTTDNCNHKKAIHQVQTAKMFDRIANLDISFIKAKQEIERAQRKVRLFEESVRAFPPIIEPKEEKKEDDQYMYAFDKSELYAISTLHESAAQLLVMTEGITKRIISHITMEEAKNILTLQNDLMCLYNNYNYHLPSVKQFEDWLKAQIKLINKEEQ